MIFHIGNEIIRPDTDSGCWSMVLLALGQGSVLLLL